MEGGAGRVAAGWCALAALAFVSALAACGESSGDERAAAVPPPGPPVQTGDPVRTFAPLIHIHSRERFYPMSTDYFLSNSKLVWTGGECPFDADLAASPTGWEGLVAEDTPRLRAALLGGDSALRYRPTDERCERPGRRAYSTAQHTRPFDTADRPAGLPENAGFYLDVRMSAWKGERRVRRVGAQARLVDVPVYATSEPAEIDGRAGLRLTYWALYGDSKWRRADNFPITSHEGDWPRLEVLLAGDGSGDRYRPVAVRYDVGDRALTVPWREVELVADGDGSATHPVAYSARLSHTLYPRAGRHSRRVPSDWYADEVEPSLEHAIACADCPRWETWETVRQATDEPWWGYGGGWGWKGNVERRSGELGPSPWSAPLPAGG